MFRSLTRTVLIFLYVAAIVGILMQTPLREYVSEYLASEWQIGHSSSASSDKEASDQDATHQDAFYQDTPHQDASARETNAKKEASESVWKRSADALFSGKKLTRPRKTQASQSEANRSAEEFMPRVRTNPFTSE